MEILLCLVVQLLIGQCIGNQDNRNVEIVDLSNVLSSTTASPVKLVLVTDTDNTESDRTSTSYNEKLKNDLRAYYYPKKNWNFQPPGYLAPRYDGYQTFTSTSEQQNNRNQENNNDRVVIEIQTPKEERYYQETEVYNGNQNRGQNGASFNQNQAQNFDGTGTFFTSQNWQGRRDWRAEDQSQNDNSRSNFKQDDRTKNIVIQIATPRTDENEQNSGALEDQRQNQQSFAGFDDRRNSNNFQQNNNFGQGSSDRTFGGFNDRRDFQTQQFNEQRRTQDSQRQQNFEDQRQQEEQNGAQKDIVIQITTPRSETYQDLSDNKDKLEASNDNQEKNQRFSFNSRGSEERQNWFQRQQNFNDQGNDQDKRAKEEDNQNIVIKIETTKTENYRTDSRQNEFGSRSRNNEQRTQGFSSSSASGRGENQRNEDNQQRDRFSTSFAAERNQQNNRFTSNSFANGRLEDDRRQAERSEFRQEQNNSEDKAKNILIRIEAPKTENYRDNSGRDNQQRTQQFSGFARGSTSSFATGQSGDDRRTFREGNNQQRAGFTSTSTSFGTRQSENDRSQLRDELRNQEDNAKNIVIKIEAPKTENYRDNSGQSEFQDRLRDNQQGTQGFSRSTSSSFSSNNDRNDQQRTGFTSTSFGTRRSEDDRSQLRTETNQQRNAEDKAQDILIRIEAPKSENDRGFRASNDIQQFSAFKFGNSASITQNNQQTKLNDQTRDNQARNTAFQFTNPSTRLTGSSSGALSSQNANQFRNSGALNNQNAQNTNQFRKTSFSTVQLGNSQKSSVTRDSGKYDSGKYDPSRYRTNTNQQNSGLTKKDDSAFRSTTAFGSNQNNQQKSTGFSAFRFGTDNTKARLESTGGAATSTDNKNSNLVIQITTPRADLKEDKRTNAGFAINGATGISSQGASFSSGLTFG